MSYALKHHTSKFENLSDLSSISNWEFETRPTCDMGSTVLIQLVVFLISERHQASPSSLDPTATEGNW